MLIDSQRTAWETSVNDILEGLTQIDFRRSTCMRCEYEARHSLTRRADVFGVRARARASPGLTNYPLMLSPGQTFMQLK